MMRFQEILSEYKNIDLNVSETVLMLLPVAEHIFPMKMLQSNPQVAS